MTSSTYSQDLLTRTYFAPTVQAAVSQARRDLGADAILLSSQRSQQGRFQGMYEVVFGAAAEPPARPGQSAATGRMEKVVRARPLVQPADEPSRPQISVQPDVGFVSPYFSQDAAPAGEVESITEPDLLAALLRCGFGESLGRSLCEAVCKRLRRGAFSRAKALSEDFGRLMLPADGRAAQKARDRALPLEDARSALAAELGRRLRVDSRLGEVPGREIAAFVGPAGHGKTSTLVKLAVARGISQGRPVRLISTDTIRIGAPEQLHRYAQLLSIPFHFCQTAEELSGALAQAGAKDLVLVDTPGFSPRQTAQNWPLAKAFGASQEIQCHLVLMATSRTDDVSRIVDRFEAFRPARLVFTRLDETAVPGVMAAEALRRNRALSFLGVGAGVPEDLRPAVKERIVRMLVGALPETVSERS